uniref:Uncharacterized protein n=1 Tax=Glossina brevipalpis TaxID=37001 RepID=A0A1A9X5M4_9MUSC
MQVIYSSCLLHFVTAAKRDALDNRCPSLIMPVARKTKRKSRRLRLPTTTGPALDTVPSCNNKGLLTKAAAIPKTAALANGMRKLLAKSALCDNSERVLGGAVFWAIGKKEEEEFHNNFERSNLEHPFRALHEVYQIFVTHRSASNEDLLTRIYLVHAITIIDLKT